jgi:hypothetical protein
MTAAPEMQRPLIHKDCNIHSTSPDTGAGARES